MYIKNKVNSKGVFQMLVFAIILLFVPPALGVESVLVSGVFPGLLFILIIIMFIKFNALIISTSEVMLKASIFAPKEVVSISQIKGINIIDKSIYIQSNNNDITLKKEYFSSQDWDRIINRILTLKRELNLA